MEDTIRVCFALGLSYHEILACLAQLNGIVISMRTLKRVLLRLKLFRRSHYSNILDVSLYILEEIGKSGQLHGYKLMHQKCLQRGFIITQDTIRHVLHIIDPRGIELRRRKRLRRRLYLNLGPNFTWHVDGYDKIKPYGICINGAIDGFSRYILWLECYHTNSDPKVVAGYFMKAVENGNGCPARIRCDKGTENGHMQQMQMLMRSTGRDQYANNCCLVGSSNHNQRIEQWWGFLRKENVQYWMNLFEMLKETGWFSGTFIDKALMQFCFMDLIQTELDEIVELWNGHRIRSSNNRNVPKGRPVVMYTCGEELYRVEHFAHRVSADAIRVCLEQCTPKGSIPCDQTVFDLCSLLKEEYGRPQPDCGEEAVLLYQFLRNEFIVGLS